VLAAPRVTVCVSTRNRSQLLRRLVDHLEQQSIGVESFELVVVDDGSTDGTSEVLYELAAITRLRMSVHRNETSRGPAAGRNLAWRHGAAQVCAFTDDDCRPTPEWLEAGLQAVGDGRVHVAGAVSPSPEDWSRVGPFSRYLIHTRANARWFAAANLFVQRQDLEAVGGFDERYRGAAGEDTDLGLRLEELGSAFVFAEKAIVHHDVSTTTVRELVQDQARWADLVGVVAAHPATRSELLERRFLWKRTHAQLLLMVLGLASGRAPVALVAALPWLHERICRDGRTDIPLEKWTSLPGTLAVDAAEVVAMIRGSLRYRTPVL
jgi:glycosyltransferase involved in cell wall biosynthesis